MQLRHDLKTWGLEHTVNRLMNVEQRGIARRAIRDGLALLIAKREGNVSASGAPRNEGGGEQAGP